MSKDSSFDIVSHVNLQEVDNAVNQARKEIAQRFDFKGTKSRIDFNRADKLLILIADDDMKLRNLRDILAIRLAKRGISLKAVEYGRAVDALEGTLRQEGRIISGISHEKAKAIVKDIKALGLKVQSSLQEEQIRVSGRKKDDLQEVIRVVRARDYALPLQIVNFR